MLSWLKYAPFKLCKAPEFCIPQGPKFSSARQLNFSLAGTKVTLKLPRHRSSHKSKESIQPKKGAIDIGHGSTRYYNQGVMKDNRWRQRLVASRSWGFWGPWFTGALGEVSFAAEVIVPDQVDTSVSFFHPRVFESMVADFLTALYDQYVSSSGALYEGPVDWRPLNVNGVLATSFYVLSHQSGDSNNRMLLLPIGDCQILKINFRIAQYCAGSQKEKDQTVDRSTMEQLVQDIIDSLEITLSPDAQAQQREALKDCDNPQLCETFPPLKWTTDEQDAQWAEQKRLRQELADLQS